MTVQVIEYVTKEKLDEYIGQAAKAAGYQNGFGITGCDLLLMVWWAAYCRQSLDQQSHNNRLPEYLLTLAKMARDQGVVVPREYVFYDHVTGEHLDRPGMQFLRHELVDKQKVMGIFFADLRCLSREPAPQQVFERECEIRGVRLIFGDAPSGMDIGSQFARSAITFSNKLARMATHGNARGGNVGRVLKGWAPSHRAPYGYIYRRNAEISRDGRIQVTRAWWEIDSLGENDKPLTWSRADVVTKMFNWIGNEGHTVYWVAKTLNEMGIKGPSGGIWSQDSVRYIMLNHCYTGKHKYNATTRVANPRRPLGDITGAIKRTLRRPKPDGEAVEFNVPELVSEELWRKANQATRERGRGRGKEGKSIPALLRNRVFCPRCGKPMAVRHRSGDDRFYYLCSRLRHARESEHCAYHRFVPHTWDEAAWDCVYAILKDDSWVGEKLSQAEKQNQDIDKLVRLEQQKITRYQNKIVKVREGYEGGLYNLDEAKVKVNGYQELIGKVEQEVKRLTSLMSGQELTVNVEELKKKLQRLAHENLEKATFTEKRDIINKLGIRVYPSEDLKTMKIRCSLNFSATEPPRSDQCRIIEFASLRSQ